MTHAVAPPAKSSYVSGAYVSAAQHRYLGRCCSRYACPIWAHCRVATCRYNSCTSRYRQDSDAVTVSMHAYDVCWQMSHLPSSLLTVRGSGERPDSRPCSPPHTPHRGGGTGGGHAPPPQGTHVHAPPRGVGSARGAGGAWLPCDHGGQGIQATGAFAFGLTQQQEERSRASHHSDSDPVTQWASGVAECCVCLTEAASVCLRCGHLCLCAGCLERLCL